MAALTRATISLKCVWILHTSQIIHTPTLSFRLTHSHSFQQQTRPPPDSTSTPPPEFHLAATKLGEAYHKRIHDHGPRTYRWPDGSLKPEKPPERPYAVANRQRWAPLVDHCRRHGGDRTFELTGHSLRYGLNVPYEFHQTYLKSAELMPENNRNGELAAYHPQQQRPLDDPEHCFNTFYKEEASLVFSKATGRLL